MTNLKFPLLELCGTPTEIGEAHGEALRDLVREHAERNLEWILTQSPASLTEERLRALWVPVIAANRAAARDLVEEMEAIARAANVPFERVFILNSLLDVGNFRWLGTVQGMLGCTTFAVPEEHGTGRALLGQTYDLASFRRRFNVLMRLKPADGPSQLVYTLAGMIGAAGLNEDGIGININYLSSNDCGAGKLHAVIVRQALAARNLADAVTAPTTVAVQADQSADASRANVARARAGGSHYLISDDTGNVVSVETSATRYALAYADGRPFGHTNHYLSEWMQPVSFTRPSAIGSSIARYTSLRRFLQSDDLTRESLKQMTRSHTSFPKSICAHGSPEESDELRGSTVAAMVQSLSERKLEICDGCACEGEYVEVSL